VDSLDDPHKVPENSTPPQRGFFLGAAMSADDEQLLVTTFVVVSIYAVGILLCVGTTAWILRAWTRRRYWYKSPSDLHYIAVGAALLVSAGIGILIASQIVVALGYAR
jgi:hypothetical protein